VPCLHSKSAMQVNKSLRCMEKTAITRCLSQQIRQLSSPGWLNGLAGKTFPFPELMEVAQAMRCDIGRQMRWSNCTLKSGNFVFLDAKRSMLFVVVACVTADDTFGVLARPAKLRSRTAYSSQWVLDKNSLCFRRLLDGHPVLHAAFHRSDADQGCVDVLH